MKTKLEKRISTAKSQITNHNTHRAKATTDRVNKAMISFKFTNKLSI